MRFLLFACLLLAACQSGTHSDKTHPGTHRHASTDSSHAHTGANAYMHQRSAAELAAQFNDPKRAEWQRPDAVISSFGDLSNRRVADLGAGSGYFTARLAPRAKSVIALEPNAEFLPYLEAVVDSLGLTNVEVRGIGYDSPGVSRGEFDDMLVVDVYHHIEDRVAYFRSFREKMADDSRLWIVDFKVGELPVGPPDGHKLSLDSVLRELQEAGYTTQADTTLLPYQFIVTAQKGS